MEPTLGLEFADREPLARHMVLDVFRLISGVKPSARNARREPI